MHKKYFLAEIEIRTNVGIANQVVYELVYDFNKDLAEEKVIEHFGEISKLEIVKIIIKDSI